MKISLKGRPFGFNPMSLAISTLHDTLCPKGLFDRMDDVFAYIALMIHIHIDIGIQK